MKSLTLVNARRYASSFLNVPKNVSATALSYGFPVAENDCLTPFALNSFTNALETYCVPRSLWNSKFQGLPLSEEAYEMHWSPAGYWLFAILYILLPFWKQIDNYAKEHFIATLKFKICYVTNPD